MKISYDEIIDTFSADGIKNHVYEGIYYSRAVMGLYQDTVVDCFFLYYYNYGTKIIYPPYARIAIDSVNKTLAWHYHVDEKPFKSTLPENFISPIKGDDTFREHRESYENCYAEIRPFAFKSAVSEEQKSLLMKYWRSFDYIVDKELKPFYAELSPEFWKWLKETCREEELGK